MVGAVSVGDVPKTSDPLPVSLEMTPASSADVVAAKADSLLAVTAKSPFATTLTVKLLAAPISSVFVPDMLAMNFPAPNVSSAPVNVNRPMLPKVI